MLGITHIDIDRIKSGVDEVPGLIIFCGFFEVNWLGKLEDGRRDVEESELLYSLVSEAGSEIGLSYEIFEGNEDGKVDGR